MWPDSLTSSWPYFHRLFTRLTWNGYVGLGGCQLILFLSIMPSIWQTSSVRYSKILFWQFSTFPKRLNKSTPAHMQSFPNSNYNFNCFPFQNNLVLSLSHCGTTPIRIPIRPLSDACNCINGNFSSLVYCHWGQKFENWKTHIPEDT